MDDFDLDAALADEEDLEYESHVREVEDEAVFQVSQEQQQGTENGDGDPQLNGDSNNGSAQDYAEVQQEQAAWDGGDGADGCGSGVRMQGGDNGYVSSNHDEEKANLDAHLPYFERRKRRLARQKYLATARDGGTGLTGSASAAVDFSRFLFMRPGSIIGGDQEVTMVNGDRKYLVLDTKKSPYHPDCLAADEEPMQHSFDLEEEEGRSLLERPIKELLAILEENERQEIFAQTKQQYEQNKMDDEDPSLNSGDGEEDCILLDEEGGQVSGQALLKVRKTKNKQAELQATDLLVDRYAPKSYMDVVSNERQSRNVLNWVIAWDLFVFGRAVSGGNDFVSNVNGRARGELRDRPRPWQKLILLSGPPGAGKTTLARIVARKCGYNPVEINASDERTGSALLARVQAAMQMQSMFGNSKPNCIILDEFEGVANMGEESGFVPLLAQMAEAPIGGSLGEDNSDESKNNVDDNDGKRKKKKSIPPVTRPIILICNDAFAPVLRPIRQHCQMVRFFPSAKNRVVSRLQQVCHMEGIRPDPGALEALCDLSNNDIRGCLHALQFAVNKNQNAETAGDAGSGGNAASTTVLRTTTTPLKERVTSANRTTPGTARSAAVLGHDQDEVIPLSTATVRSICAGQRDKGSDLFKTWEEIFHLYRGSHAVESFDRSKSKADIAYDAQTAAAEMLFKHLSEFPVVMDGVHENMLALRLADSTIDNLLAALEGLIEADKIGKFVISQGNWSMGTYLPMCGLRLRALCRADAPRARVAFPRASAAFRRRRLEMSGVVREFQDRSRRVAGVHAKSFASEFASPLLEIVSPRVRAVPWNLLNPREQAAIQSTAEALRDLGMSLQRSEEWSENAPWNANNDGDNQQRRSGTDSIFRLHPRIDKLITFAQQTPYTRAINPLPEPSWQTCSTINYRITLADINSGGAKLQNAEKSVVQNQTRTIDPKTKLQKASMSSKQAIAEKTKAVALDFFGRPIIPKSAEVAVGTVPEGDVLEITENEQKAVTMTPCKKRKQEKHSSKQITFVFKEGLTDAVRRPCYMSDFFSL